MDARVDLFGFFGAVDDVAVVVCVWDRAGGRGEAEEGGGRVEEEVFDGGDGGVEERVDRVDYVVY